MKLIIANWKMNPATEVEAVALAGVSDLQGLIITPPFPFLKIVKNNIKNAKLGAQDLFWEKFGAYTGEVSAEELKSVGVEYVIVGHSERRALGDTDEIVAKKLRAALEAGLIPILCVGESAAERGSGQAEAVVSRQLSGVLSLPSNVKSQMSNVVIAYEPIWAIGSGNPATPQDAEKMLQYIREHLKPLTFNLKPVLIYGGSVDAGNIKSFLDMPSVEGALVGGASLKSDQIIKIVEISTKIPIY